MSERYENEQDRYSTSTEKGDKLLTKNNMIFPHKSFGGKIT